MAICLTLIIRREENNSKCKVHVMFKRAQGEKQMPGDTSGTTGQVLADESFSRGRHGKLTSFKKSLIYLTLMLTSAKSCLTLFLKECRGKIPSTCRGL